MRQIALQPSLVSRSVDYKKRILGVRTLLVGLPYSHAAPGTLQRDPGVNLTGLIPEGTLAPTAVVPILKLILLPLGWA